MPKKPPFTPIPSPTAEGEAILTATTEHRNVKVEAGAGTGKTTTMRMVALNMPFRRGRYLTFSKELATDAARSGFPIECTTAHSPAMQALGYRYRDRLFSGARMRSRDVGVRLGIEALEVLGFDGRRLVLSIKELAQVVRTAVTKFCESALNEVTPDLIVAPRACETREAKLALREYLLPFVRRAWQDVQRIDGWFPFTHDCYLKMWQLSKPTLPFDYVIFDEAQDASAAMADIMARQTHAQRIYVGDRCQAIYHWRGAVDAMETFDADETLQLTQSFRFGPQIADEANKWLSFLNASLRLRGTPEIGSRLGQGMGYPRAVLCRTNAGCMREAVESLRMDGRKTSIKKSQRDKLRSLANAACQLKAGMEAEDPDLAGFHSWADLEEYVRTEEAGADLKIYVDIINAYTPERILDVLELLCDEKDADVVIATAHGAKGRQWTSVRVGDDFVEPEGGPSDPIAMLSYVTITRAKLMLDRGPLEYIDKYDKR